MSQQGQQQQQQAPVLDEWVYVLHASDGSDERDAKLWRKELLERSPRSAPKFVQEIRLARLTERHSVIVLFRRDGDAKLSACEPVRVRDCWKREGEDGVVNVQAFCSALAAGILPATLKMRRDIEEDLDYLRLGYA